MTRYDRLALARVIPCRFRMLSVTYVFTGELRGFIRKNKVNPCLPVYVG
jgi:hypothetical protein